MCPECGAVAENARYDGPWGVVDSDGKAIESHRCEHLAARAAKVLNEHAVRVGSPARYEVRRAKD